MPAPAMARWCGWPHWSSRPWPDGSQCRSSLEARVKNDGLQILPTISTARTPQLEAMRVVGVHRRNRSMMPGKARQTLRQSRSWCLRCPWCCRFPASGVILASSQDPFLLVDIARDVLVPEFLSVARSDGFAPDGGRSTWDRPGRRSLEYPCRSRPSQSRRGLVAATQQYCPIDRMIERIDNSHVSIANNHW